MREAKQLVKLAAQLVGALTDEESIKRMAPGAIRRQERERKFREEKLRELEQRRKTPVEWTKVEGVAVLRKGKSNFVAVPATGRKNSRYFQIIDLTDRSDIVTTLKKNEVIQWLYRRD